MVVYGDTQGKKGFIRGNMSRQKLPDLYSEGPSTAGDLSG